MSRIGKMPIAIPSGVKISLDGTEVKVQGPKGTLSQNMPEQITVAVEAEQVVVVGRIRLRLDGRPGEPLVKLHIAQAANRGLRCPPTPQCERRFDVPDAQ